MQQILLRKCLSALGFFLFFGQAAVAQLTNFTLQVTATNETCTGNGTLTFQTQNTTPGATIIYSVFLLPNVDTPIAVLSGNTMTGLSAGEYRVVALQTLGNESNLQEQYITILNQIVPLTFEVHGSAVSCADGTITVTAQGNVAYYEIISGPQTFPPQAGNVFANLSAGTYNIRVTDTCGDAYVQTFTLQGDSYLFVSDFTLTCEMIDCDTALSNFVVHTDEIGQPDMDIVYPLYVTITIDGPGDGPPIIVTQTINSGDDHNINVSSEIPYFNGQEYTVDVSVADSCGNTFTNNGNVVAEAFEANVYSAPGPSLVIDACHGVPPYTVEFTSFPPGFDPDDFNAGHPGPFQTLPINYSSTPGHEMPEGEYEIILTDGCGNASSGGASVVVCPVTYRVDPVCPKMGQLVSPDGVGAGLATGFIIEAPAGFVEPLPFDLAPYINEFGILNITLPPGHYIINGMSLCPRPYVFNFTIFEPTIEAEGINVFGCSSTTGSIELLIKDGSYMTSIAIVAAPTGFSHPLPYDVSGAIIATEPKTANIEGLMPGDYVLNITDFCGNVYPVPVNVPFLLTQAPPLLMALPGCAIGYGAITIASANGALTQVQILSAPASYPFPLPQDISFSINSNGAVSLSDLPEGTYSFYTKDACGVESTFTHTFTGFHIIANDVEVIGNCGSFDLRLAYSPNTLYGQFFWLQKYNPVSNVWEHPITGVDFNGSLSAANSYLLHNDAINYNIAVLGQFRIIRSNQVYTTGSILWTICTEVIKEFEFTGQLRINSAYSIPCSNGVSQVVIIAGDTFPLTYRITKKDSQDFLVENGGSNSFSGLAPGVYNFQVEDECGNIANRLFDIISLSEPQITAHDLCDGQNGYLSVQGISYLNYQWWNGADPTHIISTNSSLYFSPFSLATTPGTYYVRIYSTTSVSCIDTTVSYTIAPVSAPNAGQNADVSLCGTNSAIDLFSILGGPYDTNGYWLETSNSGMLSGHSWLPVGLAIGTYTFQYHVDGFCDDFDEATVTIRLKGAVPVPVVTVDKQFCSGGAIQFLTDAVPGATYAWTGPNNFSSNEQNPILANSIAANSGQYDLVVTVNECDASASVNVTVNASPDFNLSQHCENGGLLLEAEPVNGAFESNVVYSWTGPQNYSSSANPITITGLPAGDYALTITTDEGCTISRTINVAATRCSIPTGISPNYDGDNDELDLTGYGVLKFKIFNRYGRTVFEQDDYTNQWHGQDFNGRELPDATYYYYIRLNTGEEKTGWVYVTK